MYKEKQRLGHQACDTKTAGLAWVQTQVRPPVVSLSKEMIYIAYYFMVPGNGLQNKLKKLCFHYKWA